MNAVVMGEVVGKTIEISDAAKSSIQNLRILGSSKQFSTTGKNKLPYPYVGVTSQNGLNFRVNEDNSITIDGSATGYNEFTFANNTAKIFESGKTYCLKKPNYLGLWAYIQYTENDSTKFNDGSAPLTWNDNCVLTKINIQISEGNTINNYTYYPQIEEGTVSTDYEIYSNGLVSPSPEYPQLIKHGGQVRKNLINFSS